MFTAGNILYMEPFVFKNGASPKPKYFIILKNEEPLLIASLPTSKDCVPHFIEKTHGCLDDPNSNFNCYYFNPDNNITKDGLFKFPLETYLYGEQVDFYERDYIENFIEKYNASCSLKGSLLENEFDMLIDCIRKSRSVKRVIKKMLSFK